ncbi:zinc finger, CCHC-type containing protein, partial [Tanacetum coccineum]
NLIIHQMDVKTAFLNGDLDEEVYMNQPRGFIMHGNENKVDLTKEFLSSRLSMKDMREADVILGIRIKHESNGITISQSYYIKKILKKFNYFDCTPVSTPMDTSEKLTPNNGKLSRYTSNPGTQYWQSIERVFLLGGGAISWASKKQTCFTGSAMESEFVALAAAGQKYNEKSRHLDVRHSMIHELIMNGVISIEFVRSQQNLADHLTNGLARDLVIKSAERMGLKSN